MKSNTQNAKIEAVKENTLVVGIDVGSEFHYARAFDWRGIEFSRKPFKFSNTEPGFTEFKAWILYIQTEHDKIFSDWKRKKTNPVSEKILIICSVLDVTPYELLGATDGVGSRSNPSEMILIDKNSEYGSALMEFLALDKGRQGRLLGYLKALTEMQQDKS